MQPPYDITTPILKLIASISEKIGEINATYLDRPSPTLRKQNKIKTIHSSLQIEGNTLSEEQITALLENKRVLGPLKDIQEVRNAIEVYDLLNQYVAHKESDFLKAHKLLMTALIEKPGSYRTQGVGIVKGSKVAHLAPPYENVYGLMKDLFAYVKSDELAIIKSCVFHYEMEFIHPFVDGNGRMGRLWQTLILMAEYPVFEFIPYETLISQDEKKYYNALAASDKAGNSTHFIVYMLGVINDSLSELLTTTNRALTTEQRLNYFNSITKSDFTRKDYMNTFTDISTSTASRDLKKGIELGMLTKQGDMNKSRYGFVQKRR